MSKPNFSYCILATVVLLFSIRYVTIKNRYAHIESTSSEVLIYNTKMSVVIMKTWIRNLMNIQMRIIAIAYIVDDRWQW